MRAVSALPGLILVLSACGTDWRYRDLDGDGLTPADGDCWDREDGPEGTELSGLDIGPHAQETWYDGIDQDCAGDDDYDADGDGWVPESEHYLQLTLGVTDSGDHVGYGDCWDVPQETVIPLEYVGVDGSIFTPAEVNPGAEDSWYDGIDQDCMSDDDFDQDLDGYASADHENREGEVGEDCADTEDSIHPEADEICDEIDNDCDGLTDTEDDDVNLEDLPTWYADLDLDGFGDPATGVVTCERPDGYVEEELATDCDDEDETIHPDGDEICDEIDNDCDGLIDDEDDDLVEDTGEPFFADLDEDGFGDPDNQVLACLQPSGYLTDSSDCDDGDAQVNPDAEETCATVGVDDDCDGDIDEGDASDAEIFYMDGDEDGFGDPDVSSSACDPPSGYVSDDTDCDDSSADINVDADEICDEIDNDCDALTDEEDPGLVDASTFYEDDDGDGYGDPDATVEACEQPSNTVTDSTDCDDTDDGVHPAADEVCDEIDNNCDDVIDTDAIDISTWYADADEDGYGDADEATISCDAPSGHVSDDTDCDDGDEEIYPGATELCDSVDNDCDGDIDEDDAADVSTWYADDDSDGFGDSGSSTESCDAPSGTVADATDCDDDDSTIHPDATEICDGIDNDCDKDVDDDDSSLDTSTGDTWYADSDGDGYGDSGASEQTCEQPSGTTDNGDDCDDDDEDINPDASEICDGLDNDCDEDVDDADSDLDTSTATLFYRDSDGDGFGSSSGPTDRACEEPSGYSDDSDDCDDSDADVNPDADEVCNDGLDNDCDGTLEATADGGICELSDLDLEDANVRFTGSASDDVAGSQVALLPDIDGDGIADLAIGAPYEDTGGNAAGAVYIYTGLDSLDWDDQTTRDLDSTYTFMVYGEAATDHAGRGIAGGDFDGDGYADLLVTAPHNDNAYSGAGIGYLFYGPSTETGAVSLAGADGSYEGYAAGDFAGWSASMSGDVDGDGCDDIMVGAPQDPVANSGAGSATGEGYVILIPGSYSSSGCSGSGSLVLYYGEEDEDAAGYALGFVDTDGDGDSEVLIGAPQADLGAGSNSGAVYLSPGDETSFFVELGDDMVSFAGESKNDRVGWSLAGGGDTNDDGYEDVLIGSTQDDDGASNGGAVYVFLGPVSISETEIDVADADAKLTGEATNDGAGYAVDFGGTLNDDDYDDVLVGAWKEDSGATDAGATYVLFGPVTGSIGLGSADVVLTGEARSDQSGVVLAGGEDVNDDGLDDILIGARYADDGGSNSGAAYLILGLGQ